MDGMAQIPLVETSYNHGAESACCVSRIYLGRTIAADRCHDSRQTEVRDSSVRMFLENVAAAYLLEGFTVFEATGGYAKDGQVILEKSLVIETCHPDGDVSAHAAVDYVAREWARWFHQDSVLVTRTPALMRSL